MASESRVAGAADAGAGGENVDYRRLFDLALDLLCVAGLDGRFRRVNPSWTRLLGWSEAELLARPVVEFMHPDDRERTLAARAGLAAGVPVAGLENRYLCKDGSHRWLAWQSAVDLGSSLVYAVARDITEQRQRAHEHLVFSKLECTGLFAGGIAHDFNNLFGALHLGIDMLGVCGPLNAEQQKYVAQAKAAVQSATALTRQLNAFAEGGRGEPRRLAVAPLVREAAAIALLGAEVRTEFQLAHDLWDIEGDEAQLSQVFSGIVLNAREASGPQGQIVVAAENNPGPNGADFVRVRVTDRGPGIAPEIMAKVFDPYFTTKERGSRKGTGLGLTICRTVIRRHDGTITLESAPGAGTTVTILLPALRSTAV